MDKFALLSSVWYAPHPYGKRSGKARTSQLSSSKIYQGTFFHLEHIDTHDFPGYQSVPYLVMHHQSTVAYGPVQPDLPLVLHHVHHLCQEQSLSVHHHTHWCDVPSYYPYP